MKLKISKVLDSIERGEGLKIDMKAILKETKEEIFKPEGKKKTIYVSSTKKPNKTPLDRTGKFKRSLFVSGTTIKSRDNKKKVNYLKNKYGSQYFKPSFKDIMKYIQLNTK